MSRRVHTCIGGLIFCVGAVLLSLSFQGRVEANNGLLGPQTPCHTWCDTGCKTKTPPNCDSGICKTVNHPNDPQIVCTGCQCQPKQSNPMTKCWCYR